MIRSLDQITNLAIVGLSVVVPNGGGIGEFGRLVYRGLPVTGQFGDGQTLDAAIVKAIQQVCGQANTKTGQVPVISLSPSIIPILQAHGIGSRVQDVSSVSEALVMASDWCESSDDDVVLLVEVQDAPQAVCALLVTECKPALDNARSIYALITGAARADGLINAATISATIQEAQRISGIPPEAIGLIEAATLTNAGIRPEEAGGMLGSFGMKQPLRCALDHAYPGLLGVVKTAWCLSQRVIPGVPGWVGPGQPEIWVDSPFYVPTESRAWFTPSSQSKRHAGLNLLEAKDRFTHILFCDAASPALLRPEAPRREALRIFPFAANSVSQLLEKMMVLQSKLTAGANLAGIAESAYQQYLAEKPSAEHVACLLGSTPDELLREIGFAMKGIPTASDKQLDWHTPLGSCFTPRPLGKEGKVSFVYPGAFNSYPGAGRDLFHLFPNLYNHISGLTGDIGDVLNERLLYPRSMTALTSTDLAAIEARLTADPIAMLISGSCLAVLYTDVLRTVFEIHPASAFGYSLGEISMLFSSRVWMEADQTSKALRESPLFRTRLSGPQNAVREFWNLPTRNESDPHEPLWMNYLLMIGPEKVREVLPDEPRVYLTHINTPNQVVIGGDPAACRRVINKLKSKSIQAPFNYAIHCEPIHSEYGTLTELHSVPVVNQPGMTLFSAATYQPMPIDRQRIAQQIAHELCNCLDFPRLIHSAYKDGARVFIELGAGSNCARWINDTLQGQPHAAYSINRKGVDDHTSILRLIARLVSQQVPVNPGVLYQD